jgi:hypothetical protein
VDDFIKAVREAQAQRHWSHLKACYYKMTDEDLEAIFEPEDRTTCPTEQNIV